MMKPDVFTFILGRLMGSDWLTWQQIMDSSRRTGMMPPRREMIAAGVAGYLDQDGDRFRLRATPDEPRDVSKLVAKVYHPSQQRTSTRDLPTELRAKSAAEDARPSREPEPEAPKPVAKPSGSRTTEVVSCMVVERMESEGLERASAADLSRWLGIPAYEIKLAAVMDPLHMGLCYTARSVTRTPPPRDDALCTGLHSFMRQGRIWHQLCDMGDLHVDRTELEHALQWLVHDGRCWASVHERRIHYSAYSPQERARLIYYSMQTRVSLSAATIRADAEHAAEDVEAFMQEASRTAWWSLLQRGLREKRTHPEYWSQAMSSLRKTLKTRGVM